MFKAGLPFIDCFQCQRLLLYRTVQLPVGLVPAQSGVVLGRSWGGPAFLSVRQLCLHTHLAGFAFQEEAHWDKCLES